MREPVEQAFRYNGRGHIESQLLLAPSFGNAPLALPKAGGKRMNAAVLRTEKNLAIVKSGGRHVLVVGLVGKGVLPEQASVLRFHTDKSPMVPSHNLVNAVDLGVEWG